MPQQKFTILEARDALIANQGNIAGASRDLKVDSKTLRERMDRFPILREICEALVNGETPPEILSESSVVKVHWRSPKELDPEEVWYALIKSQGVRSQAARLLGVYPKTVHNTIKAYPELEVLVDEIEEAKVEDLEAMHYERAFTDKNPASRIHWLETQKPQKWLRRNMRFHIQITPDQAARLMSDREEGLSDAELEQIRDGNFEVLEPRPTSGNGRVGTEATKKLPAKSD